MSRIRVLYIDDSDLDRELVQDALNRDSSGIELVTAATPNEFITRLSQGEYDLVLSDFNILGFEGLQVFDIVRARYPILPVVLVTGTGSEEVAVEAMRRGVNDYVIKTPSHIRHLPQTIRAVLDKQRLAEERIQAEKALRESEALLKRSQAIGHIGSWQLDIVANRLTWSDEVFRIFGMRPREFAHTNEAFFELVHPDDRAAVNATYALSLGDGQDIYESEYRIIRQDSGEVRVVHEIYEHVKDDSGKVVFLIGMLQDITERKQAEEEIRRLNASLELRVEERTQELREAQDQLVRNEKLAILGQLAGGVGHELRNPLGVINTSIYYLKLVLSDANEKVKQHLAIIEQEVHNADRIINDLLDFARVKTIDREPVDATSLVEYALNRFPSPSMVNVELDIPEDLPLVFVDPVQIEQVLENLILNAYQAMKNNGELRVSAVLEDNMVAVAIQDNGSGITPENMKKLFDPLFTTKAKGIGLGLTVCKKFLEANGGRIEVSSELGKGSTFRVFLPLHARQAQPDAASTL